MFQWLYTYVASSCVLNVSSVFRRMLQVRLSGCFICFYIYDVSDFQVFLQVFHTHVSNILFVFSRMLQLLHLNVLELDRVLHLPPRLSAVSPRCQARKDRDSPPCRARGSHVLVGGRSRRDVGGQAQDVKRG